MSCNQTLADAWRASPLRWLGRPRLAAAPLPGRGGVAAGTRGRDRVQHPRRPQGPRRGTRQARPQGRRVKSSPNTGSDGAPSPYRVRRRRACRRV